VTVLEDSFSVPEEFDPDQYVSHGRVFFSPENVEVPVRYPVADPEWLVRHVLEHGPDTEVLAPPGLRARVRAAVDAVRVRHRPEIR
jgi:predicted DNA-binding transcriptional regulator YafY